MAGGAGGNAIRGSRVGAGPMGESERGERAPRIRIAFYCANGHETRPSFAEDAAGARDLGLPALRLPGRHRPAQHAAAAAQRAVQDAPGLRARATQRRRRRGHPAGGARQAAAVASASQGLEMRLSPGAARTPRPGRAATASAASDRGCGRDLNRSGAATARGARVGLLAARGHTQTSLADWIAARVMLMRVGGGLGQSCTATTVRSLVRGRRLREHRCHVSFRARGRASGRRSAARA